MKVLAETPDESEAHDEWQGYLEEVAALIAEDPHFLSSERRKDGILLRVLDEIGQEVEVLVSWQMLQAIRQRVRFDLGRDQILAPRAAA